MNRLFRKAGLVWGFLFIVAGCDADGDSIESSVLSDSGGIESGSAEMESDGSVSEEPREKVPRIRKIQPHRTNRKTRPRRSRKRGPMHRRSMPAPNSTGLSQRNPLFVTSGDGHRNPTWRNRSRLWKDCGIRRRKPTDGLWEFDEEFSGCETYVFINHTEAIRDSGTVTFRSS